MSKKLTAEHFVDVVISLYDFKAMFVINDDHAVNSLIIFNEFNEERTCKDNSELHVLMILFNIVTINVINIKIMFIESNDKDA